jgi:hypothetical protein
MSEILTPCFELFRSIADFLAKLNKGISETVWVEIRDSDKNNYPNPSCY